MAKPYKKTIFPSTAKVYINLISLSSSLSIIDDILVLLVELSTINKIVITIQVLIISYHKVLLTMIIFMQLEQLVDAYNTNLGNGFMAVFIRILVMFATESILKVIINLFVLY